MRTSGWSSDVCSSDLARPGLPPSRLGKWAHDDHPPARCAPNREAALAPRTFAGQAWPPIEDRGCRRCLVMLPQGAPLRNRSEEHTSELQSLMRSSYDVFCLNKKKITTQATLILLMTLDIQTKPT